MIRGICQSAWVEQERHGSKQRMAASTRLSIPSCNLRETIKWTNWKPRVLLLLKQRTHAKSTEDPRYWLDG